MRQLKFILCALVFASASASAAELIRAANPIEGQYIVVFHKLTEGAELGAAARSSETAAKALDRSTEILGQISERDADSPAVRAVMDAAVDLAVDYNLDVRQTYVHALQGIAVRAAKADIERLLAQRHLGSGPHRSAQPAAEWNLRLQRRRHGRARLRDRYRHPPQP